MDFLNNIVGYVTEGDESALLQLSKIVGEQHAQMTRVKFEPDWWDMFTSSVLDSIRPYFTGLGKESTLINAWKTLLNQVVLLMKEAFYQKIRSLSDLAANDSDTPTTATNSPCSIRKGKDTLDIRKFGSLPATPVLGAHRANRNLMYSPTMTRIQRLETLEDWEEAKSNGDKKPHSLWSALKNGKS